ncbi:hypothetical protein D5H75_13785 [Bailinhaonella thermotolerans]|uniref:Uncharacterized protein n=1 Tax=Bailinhaonella thermotolerans TaxID=1070861 RepID=A0A3A4B342_9ACTN|nr:hypothetical protein D5H75_13785 [Bailinhaonella thermotolerans]
MAGLVRLARARGASLVNIGHGRSPGAIAAARAFAESWQAYGGAVGAVVSWPATAASWLRQARRLTTPVPDLWVIADDAPGWSAIAPRLLETGLWDPGRTIAFSALAHPGLPTLAGDAATEGLMVTRPDGTPAVYRDDRLLPLPLP